MLGGGGHCLASQVKEIALRITGADDGEIEADTPLMEAGLTSNSVVPSEERFHHSLSRLPWP